MDDKGIDGGEFLHPVHHGLNKIYTLKYSNRFGGKLANSVEVMQCLCALQAVIDCCLD